MDVKFSPDGRFLLIGGMFFFYDGGSLSRILSLTTGQELRLFPPSGSVAWSPDGKHVLLDFFGVSTLWDVRDILADLRVVNSQGGPEVHWDTGTLQYATALDGTWTDLPVTSPLRLSTIGRQGYFRVIVQ